MSGTETVDSIGVPLCCTASIAAVTTRETPAIGPSTLAKLSVVSPENVRVLSVAERRRHAPDVRPEDDRDERSGGVDLGVSHPLY